MSENRIIRKIIPLLLCVVTLSLTVPFWGIASDERLLEVDSSVPAANTDNAFITVSGGNAYNGITLNGDYGKDTLSVSVISNNADKLIIDLNGHTLTLAYLALNMDVEVRGKGTLKVINGVMIYAGELYLGDGVEITTESSIGIMNHGSESLIHIGNGVKFSLPADALAEIGVQYEYKDNPINFDTIPDLDGYNAENAVAGTDYYRLFYNDHTGELPTVSSAQVAEFSTEDEAESALKKGVVSVINPFYEGAADSDEDDAYMKVSDNRVVIGKSEAILSHATLTLDGSLGINLYFDLSGVGNAIETLGSLNYSGIGEGGSLTMPEQNSDGKYRFTIFISPMDMTKTVKVWFEGDATGKSWEYSVVKYAQYILGSNGAVFSDTIKDLMASMLNYGAAMQILNGETENLANEILKGYDAYDDAEEIAAKVQASVNALGSYGYAHSAVSYSDINDRPITFGFVSLVVNDTTTIRVYLNEGYSTDTKYSYYVSYLSYDASDEEGAMYENTVKLDSAEIAEKGYVDIKGIASGDFHRVFQISVKNNDSNKVIATCEMTVLAYAKTLYDTSVEGSVERALAEAIIWYGMSGVAYFN